MLRVNISKANYSKSLVKAHVQNNYMEGSGSATMNLTQSHVFSRYVCTKVSPQTRQPHENVSKLIERLKIALIILPSGMFRICKHTNRKSLKSGHRKSTNNVIEIFGDNDTFTSNIELSECWPSEPVTPCKVACCSRISDTTVHSLL